jgi:integrase
MRRGEIMALRWDGIDLAARTARLEQTKTVPRTAPLSPAAVAALRGLPRRLDGCLWPWRSDLSHVFATLCKRAGVTGLHFHDPRHEAASRLFERGLAIQEVAAITGQKTWAMLKHYAHRRAEGIGKKLAGTQS